MIKTLTTAAIVGAVSFSFVAFAQADQFAATPMNPGPPSFMSPPAPAAAPMMERPMMHKTMMKKKKKKMAMKKDM